LKNGHSLGFGFLTLEANADPQEVIKSINGKSFDKRKIRAEVAVAEKAVFVANLPPECTEKDVETIFKDTKFLRISIIMNKEKTACKGFAFVHFENLEAANKAIESVKGTTINNTTIKVELAKNRRRRRYRSNYRRNNRRAPRKGSRAPRRPKRIPNDQREKAPNTVHVGRIDASAKEDEVKALFADFKPVSFNYRVRRSTAYAFIEFESPEVATKVIEKFNDFEFKGAKLVCNVAYKKIEPKAAEEAPAKKE